jgi:hypothetical protein
MTDSCASSSIYGKGCTPAAAAQDHSPAETNLLPIRKAVILLQKDIVTHLKKLSTVIVEGPIKPCT